MLYATLTTPDLPENFRGKRVYFSGLIGSWALSGRVGGLFHRTKGQDKQEKCLRDYWDAVSTLSVKIRRLD